MESVATVVVMVEAEGAAGVVAQGAAAVAASEEVGAETEAARQCRRQTGPRACHRPRSQTCLHI